MMHRLVQQSRLYASLLLTAYLSIGGCGATRENDPIVVNQATLDIALQQAVEQRLVKSVKNFATEASLLFNRAVNFCAAPVTATLQETQQSWQTLALAWYRLLPYNFGPLTDNLVFLPYSYVDSLRLRGTDYTGTVREDIADNLASTKVLNEAFFANEPFQKVGLLALELALFETSTIVANPPSHNDEMIVEEFIQAPRKCQILLGLAQQLLARSESFEDGWEISFKGTQAPYKTLFVSGQLEEGAAPITQLFNSVQAHLDYLKQRSVVTTAAQASGIAWDLISATIDEIELLLAGERTTTVSFFSLLISAGQSSSVDIVQSNIAGARTSIASRDAENLEAYLALLDGNFKREIPNGLDVELGITFTDGD